MGNFKFKNGSKGHYTVSSAAGIQKASLCPALKAHDRVSSRKCTYVSQQGEIFKLFF